MSERTIAVIVLGDIGCSPRMQFHALSLADSGFRVDLIGYRKTEPLPEVSDHSRIRVLSLGPPPTPLSGGKRLRLSCQILRRSISEQLSLIRVLLYRCRGAQHILIQNPPAIPLLPVVLLKRLVNRATIIVDCHNFGASLLALRFGCRSVVVRCYSFLERHILRHATHTLCVSMAMQDELKKSFNVENAVVLYDLPRQITSAAAASVKHQNPLKLLSGVAADPTIPGDLLRDGDSSETQRSFVAICPTSWTSDDDFDLLLDAVRQAGQMIRRRQLKAANYRKKLIIVITGQGPLKAGFLKRIRTEEFFDAVVTTAWFSYEKYCQVLATADLGLCIHRSSSGFDLPMKLADMKAATLPACVLDYGPSLREQVLPNVGDQFYSTADELSEILTAAFFQHAKESAAQRFGQQAEKSTFFWEDQWRKVMHPLLNTDDPSGD